MAERPATSARALAARGRIPASEARMFLREVTGCSAAQVAAYPERGLDAEQAARYVELLERRAAGEPVAYLLGEREFYGRSFGVSPAVLIPRPETELIVDLVKRLRRGGRAPAILDLGTGSGRAGGHAGPRDPGGAGHCGRSVARCAGGCPCQRRGPRARVAFRRERLVCRRRRERFDFIVSNPPHIVDDDPTSPRATCASSRARLAAPRAAAGWTTHADHRRRAGLPGAGRLALMEHGYDQARRCARCCRPKASDAVASARDLAGIRAGSPGRYPPVVLTRAPGKPRLSD